VTDKEWNKYVQAVAKTVQNPLGPAQISDRNTIKARGTKLYRPAQDFKGEVNDVEQFFKGRKNED
jgi:hypothetical protein